MKQHILLKAPGEQLEPFSERAFGLIGAVDPEVRESGHYVDGEYVVGHIGPHRVVVAIADDSEFPDADFWIAVSDGGSDDREAADRVDEVARKLAGAGYRCVRAMDFGEPNGLVFAYFPDHQGGARKVETRSPYLFEADLASS